MKKKVLITGSNGFVGKNLVIFLTHAFPDFYEINKASRETSDENLRNMILSSDVIVHLAGENRPKNERDFRVGNVNYLEKICEIAANRKIPIISNSSTQVECSNSYGSSKLAGEALLKLYHQNTGSAVSIFRFPNIFGKWCKPNYNSFIATMCHNIWRDIPINIDNKEKIIRLVYIDDVVRSITEEIKSIVCSDHLKYLEVNPVYDKSLGEIFEKLIALKNSQFNFEIQERAVGFDRALAATFMSYCPKEKIKYPLKEYSDTRGSFYEVLRQGSHGQVSISTTRPGVTRGNHFHYSKQERFLVLQGVCLFDFRSLNTGERVTFSTSSSLKEMVEVPLGFTHNFTNIGEDELVVLIWCNEEFDRNKPDTYFLEV